jgi:hypothetical protein
MKEYWGSGGIATRIFFTSALDGGEWSDSRPRRFTPHEKSPWYPLDSGLGESQSRSGQGGGEEENSQSLPRPEPPIIQPVAQSYTTELCRLTFHLDLLLQTPAQMLTPHIRTQRAERSKHISKAFHISAPPTA